MRISRRNFIAGIGLLGASLSMPRPAAAGGLPYPPGIQLWTVKEEMARDLKATLRALGEMGYRRVETAGWHGRTPDQFRKAVQAAGLDAVSAHYGLKDLIDDSEGRLGFARDVGVQYVVASSPAPSRPLDPGKPWAHAMADAMTLADWRSNAEAMERIGRRAREMGLRFGYHNHSAEFLDYAGAIPMDEIVRLTDPGPVVVELDIGWVAGAGHDPVATIHRYAPRIHLLHIKDLATAERVPGRLATDSRTTVIGEGTIDWPAVFRARRSAPVHSYFVEPEDPFTEPPLQAAAKSLAYLRGLGI
ncbi:MAG TPA: sugar phosphate isomerase/epimerase [Sphingomicrobium sp.]|nr:sugar phosphate isomerase/epimerase [Sphingomicrobium sp.]